MIEFVKVANVEDIQEGRLYPIDVDGEPICLTRIDGVIHAFSDNCTHISGPLNEGRFEHGVITCPWHLAQFDVRTGEVLRGPARQELALYEVKIDGNAVLIGLPEE